MDSLTQILLTIFLITISVIVVNETILKKIQLSKVFSSDSLVRIFRFVLPLVLASNLFLVLGFTDWFPFTIILTFPSLVGMYGAKELGMAYTTTGYTGMYSFEFIVVALIINLLLLILTAKMIDLIISFVRRIL